MILDEFLVKLGVISDPKDLDTFVAGLQKAATVATAVVGVVGGATAAITNFFGAALDGLDSLNDIAQDTDTDLAYIQKLGYAAQLSGASVEAANASVKGLSQTIGEAASGLGRGEAAFKAYGLSAKNADGSVKSVGQVLEDVQVKMAKLSKAEQLSMLGKLGIDQSMIGLLNSTNAEMSALFQQAEDLGLVTAAGADAAGEFNDTMDQMNMVMGAIRTNIAVGLAPQLTNIVGRLRDWLIRNKELIRDGIDKAVTVILALWRAIMRAVDVVDTIISKTIGWKAALIILGGTLLWFNKTMILAFATNPITLVVAAIAGLILLVDDLITFMEGGESMFDWSWAVPIIEDVGKAIDVVSAVLQGFWDRAGKYVLAGFGGLWEFVKGFVAWLGNAIAAVFNLMTGDFDGFLLRSQASLEGLKQMFFGAVEYVKSLFAVWLTLLGVDVDALVTKFTGAWESIKTGFSGAMGVITGAWDKAKAYLDATWGWLVGKFDAAASLLSAAWSKFTAWVQESTAPLVEHFTQIWNIISNAFGAAIALLKGDFDGFLSHVDGIIAAVQAIFANAWGVISAVATEFFGLLGVDVDAIGKRFSDTWDTVKSGFSGAMDFISSLWGKVSGSITKGLDAISGTLNWLGNKLGITSDDAAEAAKKVGTASGMTAQAQASAHPSNSQSTVNNKQNTANSTFNITQNITTDNPQAAGQYAVDGVKREQQRATQNYMGAVGG